MRAAPHYLPALVTPFTRSGEVDLDAHRHNLAFLGERGVRGFLVGGSTGEGPYLEPGERFALIESARRAGRRTYVLAGVAAESTRQAMAQAEEAASAGADALLVLTPTALARNDHQAVAGFFEDLADHSPLPLLLYSVPRYTGYELPLEAAVRLAAHPGIIGMKDSGGHPVKIARLVAAAPPGFLAYTGASAAVVLSVAGGAHGAITASGNYAPGLAVDLVRGARRAPRRAGALQQRLTGLSAVVEPFGVPGVKTAAEVIGMRPGFPRAPLRRLTGKDAAGIKTALGGAGWRAGASG